MTKRISLSLVWLCLFTAAVWGQRVDTIGVYLAARAMPGCVALRWAPADIMAWGHGLQHGYQLERIQLAGPQGAYSTNQQRTSRVVLAAQLLPWPEPAWKPLLDTSDMAVIAAGSLYSTTFASTALRAGEVGMDNLNQEAENRYGFGLFAADQAMDIALAMGLGWRDSTAERGCRYRYLLRPLGGSATLLTPAVEVDISADERLALPPPTQVKAHWRHRKVELSWSRAGIDTFYTSYYVERSDDGGRSFHPINRVPIFVFTADGNEDDRMYYHDTLPHTEQEYRYRIRGKSSFGEWGQPSVTLQGKSAPPPVDIPPVVTLLEELPEGAGLRVVWQVDASVQALVQGFVLESAPEKDGPFVAQHTGLLAPASRYFVVDTPTDGWYHRVILLDHINQPTPSAAVLGLLKDQTPPAPPQGLQARVDTAGVATLSWLPNREPDLQGYRIYTANLREGTYVELTYLPQRDTVFVHQLSMATLTEVDYCKVRAIDFRGNYSDFSEAVALRRPDLLPPTPPVIHSLRADTQGVYLGWAISHSADVVQHQLQRRRANDPTEEWHTLYQQLPGMATVYHDRSGAPGQPYLYRVTATDDSGLTATSATREGGRIDVGRRGAITGFRAVQSADPGAIELHWQYQATQPWQKFILYRAAEGEPLSLYRTIRPEDVRLQQLDQRYQYQDQGLRAGQRYQYRIQALHGDGGYSDLSDLQMQQAR